MRFCKSQELVAEVLGIHRYTINPARALGPRLFSIVAGLKNNGLVGRPIRIVPIGPRCWASRSGPSPTTFELAA